MTYEFDDVLKRVGGFGWYQKRLIAVMLLPVSFFLGIVSNFPIFQLMVPDHWCYTPGHHNTGLTPQQWRDITIPRSAETGEYARCEMYEYQLIGNDSVQSYVITNATKGCVNGWEYDHSQYTSTVATSYDWVCERQHFSHTVMSVSIAGNAVGTFFLPIIADKFVGRRLMFFICLAMHIAFTLPLLLASSFYLHSFLRFLQGLCFETNYLMPYVITMEIISAEKKALAAMLSFAAWTIGMCLAALLAWAIPNWKYLALLSCIPNLAGFAYWWVLPESPRWLVSRGQFQSCADILVKVGKVNGVSGQEADAIEAELRKVKDEAVPDVPLTHAFKFPKLGMRAVLLFIICFCTYLMYGVLLLGINILPNNSFLSHFVLSIFELPSSLLGWAFTDFLGRRFTFYASYLLIAGFCIAATFFLNNPWVLLVLLSTVKLFVTQALLIIFVFTAEIFPTPVRTSAFGVTVVFGLMAVAVAPHVLYADQGEMFKYWMILVMTGVALLASLPLPETIGLLLPQTFQDAEDLGQGRPFFSWVHHWNKHRYLPHQPKQHHNAHNTPFIN